MIMLRWICLICILLFVGKVMYFFSMSALLDLHNEKTAPQKTKKRRAPSPSRSYAATGTYGKMYETGYIKSKRSI